MPRSVKRKTANKVGRPPAGDDGERVKDYPQVCFRLPKEWRERLIALSRVRGQPQWRLIVDSVDCYLRECRELGFDIVEISCGFITIPPFCLPSGSSENFSAAAVKVMESFSSKL